MIGIKKIYKKDVPSLLGQQDFWDHEFLSVSKHRLIAHSKNPTCDEGDVVLLLAYLEDELVGYMGLFQDNILLDGSLHKIGWLSTWWVHPKTKGKGVGREILNTMYEVNNGRIGISQFTPSAKRVYDKSGYFVDLKISKGIKAVMRSNLTFVVPTLFPATGKIKTVFSFADNFLNFFINFKIGFQKAFVARKLKNITVEYLTIPDEGAMEMVNRYGKTDISPKGSEFFHWLKAYQWVQSAPLLNLTDKDRYLFSMVDVDFDIFLMKIMSGTECIAFIVLQKRNFVCKLLFSYTDGDKYARIISNVITLQCMRQNIREIISYDSAISKYLKKSWVFLYKTKKTKHAIISKVFNKNNFDDVRMNLGDGDCSFT